MTDAQPNTQTVQKQDPTPATYNRSAVSAGNAIGTPVIAGVVFGYIFRAIHAVWPMVEVPTDEECIHMGLAVSGMLAWWASYSIRGTQIRGAP